MYPSILSFKTINKLNLFFECGIPRPQDVGHLRLRYCKFHFVTHFIISIAVLENVPPDAGLQKRATFSTLNIGLAGTGNRTRATCVASSGTNRSAIHYAWLSDILTGSRMWVHLLQDMGTARVQGNLSDLGVDPFSLTLIEYKNGQMSPKNGLKIDLI
jgi:hypothetical protein